MGSFFESVTDKAQTGSIKPQTFSGSGSDPDALIPVSEFIKYVEAFEQEYPNFSPEQTLTYIRQWYYNSVLGIEGLKFRTLIPDAGIITAPPPIWVDRNRFFQSVQHLKAKADENGVQDNPSPYLVEPSGEKIDIGHAFLGLDALIHRRTEAPYTTFGIPNIDPANWVADLAVAIQWITKHEDNGKPDTSAPKKAASLVKPYLDEYYKMSAPDPDLLGDADSFGLWLQWSTRPRRVLSQVLRSYYLGDSVDTLTVKRRWQIFCKFPDPKDSLVMFPFTQSGNQISWDSSIIPRWTIRIERLTDLLIKGSEGVLTATWSSLSAPPPKQYRDTTKILSRFLDWLKLKLESEIQRP
ncbi:hypothetical protein [Nitrosomonas ureae]|uniref:Uncharacterized protein n=1 Tax=Nitrosomonas ureae TaxID=44577 RepID=A0A286AL63_9PROT|nr:hypothetical protein [Nitrosomonas ureae]SOD22624.1 hypothetical protein SAMN06297164_3531 [Nitrosomonas ureae]